MLLSRVRTINKESVPPVSMQMPQSSEDSAAIYRSLVFVSKGFYALPNDNLIISTPFATYITKAFIEVVLVFNQFFINGHFLFVAVLCYYCMPEFVVVCEWAFYRKLLFMVL